jgi:hypothetical protein
MDDMSGWDEWLPFIIICAIGLLVWKVLGLGVGPWVRSALPTPTATARSAQALSVSPNPTSTIVAAITPTQGARGTLFTLTLPSGYFHGQYFVFWNKVSNSTVLHSPDGFSGLCTGTASSESLNASIRCLTPSDAALGWNQLAVKDDIHMPRYIWYYVAS